MNIGKYKQLLSEVNAQGGRLVAVSKTKPVEDIMKLYDAGQRIFGENKVQELVAKAGALPKDIEWHFIGHLQTNKVKQLVPHVSLIHSVDSRKLLHEINKQAQQQGRVVDCLLQIYIADEETKYGLSEQELDELLDAHAQGVWQHMRICGLMGMATNTDDQQQIGQEFDKLSALFKKIKARYFAQRPEFKELSMGMSADYPIALSKGATLVRIGSIIFGER
jgi:pyridoxal phosphate enzyme (YggS family)